MGERQLPNFAGYNFNNWKFRKNTILEKEQLSPVLTEKEPMDSAKKNEFLLNDANAKDIIIQGLLDKHLDIIKDVKTAKQL